MKKYRRAIALFLAIGLMVLIPSGMGVSASGNTVEAKMSENIAQVLSMTGIEREEYSDQQVIDVDGQRVRQLVFDDNLKVDMDGANVKAISHFTACTNDAIVVYGEDDISETVNNIRDAAVWAADQVPGYHTAPIKFIGDRTYRGFV